VLLDENVLAAGVIPLLDDGQLHEVRIVMGSRR